ncbi:MAG: ABC transporter ATP-binding protein, partial [Promethearchaeota archaeon]
DRVTDANTRKKLHHSTFTELGFFICSILSFLLLLVALLSEGIEELPTLQGSISNLTYIFSNIPQIIGLVFFDPLLFLNNAIATALTLPFNLVITSLQEMLNLILPINYVGTCIFVALLLFTVSLCFYFYFSWIQKGKIADLKVLELFNEIGLSPSTQYYFKYPHEVSGGERQRVSIARAIILNPDLLIADEPTSMLDVSRRAGILDSLKSLQLAHNLAILFITHDLATARHFGDRIAIMYVGKVVEMGEVDEIFKRPFHPYTTALIDAIPTPIPGEKDYELPKGEVADAINPPSGCRFHPRCSYADLAICSKEEPKLVELQPNHWIACHFPLSQE